MNPGCALPDHRLAGGRRLAPKYPRKGDNNNRPAHAPSRMTDRVYRFAEFELHLAAGELRTGDSCVRLQEKPLRLLTVLLDHPQSIVTREQLRERMWDSRTVVDYEQGRGG